MAWCAALSRGGWPQPLHDRLAASLWRQARVLSRSVEHDIGGNHVLRNAAALAIAGACLQAPRLRAKGVRILRGELDAQLLPDGGHEERSPSYQRHIRAELADVRTVLDRAADHETTWLGSALDRMDAWLEALAGPDRTLPLLNDAWEGPPLASSSASPFVDLADSGYVIMRHGSDQAVLDVAPVAPAHLPAHAHADVLSFVLWADGRPLVVDPGAYEYAGPERDVFRATAAHSTVEVDGMDQCDFWGPFRAAGMPRVRRIRTDVGESAVVLVAEHDGYRRLADPAVHRRAFCWLPGDGVVVLDVLVAQRPHRVRSALQLAPGVVLGPGDRLGPYRLEQLGSLAPLTTEPGRYAAFLGRAVETAVVRQAGEARPGEPFGWALVRDGVAVRTTQAGAVVERPSRAPVELAF
jgi:uncharacterized heparinase superfamily protein